MIQRSRFIGDPKPSVLRAGTHPAGHDGNNVRANASDADKGGCNGICGGFKLTGAGCKVELVVPI